MCEAVSPLPQYIFMALYLVKHRDNSTSITFYSLFSKTLGREQALLLPLYIPCINSSKVSPFIINVVISRRMMWTRHIGCVGEERSAYKILV
jgi:hypothetical protein